LFRKNKRIKTNQSLATSVEENNEDLILQDNNAIAQCIHETWARWMRALIGEKGTNQNCTEGFAHPPPLYPPFPKNGKGGRRSKKGITQGKSPV
jgi:hypothetical protein